MSRSSEPKQRTKKRWIVVLSMVLVLLLVIGGAGAYLWSKFGDRVSLAMGWTTNDFEGKGHGEAIVTIRDGDILSLIHI